MKKIFLFTLVPFAFLITLSAQITREQADEIVLERITPNMQSCVIAKEDVQAEGITITTSSGEILELNYPCWVYYVSYRSEHNEIMTGKYLIVKENSGNLLEINVRKDAIPNNLVAWRTVFPVENPFTDYSVWKYTDNNGTVIELTFYPENKIHLKSTPEELGYSYRMSGNMIIDYRILCNQMMYWKSPDDNEFEDKFFWGITDLSENEMVLEFFSGSLWPPLYYINRYLFIRQPD